MQSKNLFASNLILPSPDGYANTHEGDGVRRFLVTAAVPVGLTDLKSFSAAKEAIIECLLQSVQSGRLLSLALSNAGHHELDA